MKKIKKNSGKIKISKDMTFAELLSVFPKASDILLKYNIHCIGCPFSSRETIEQGATIHGIDIKKLIKEIEEEISKRK